MNILQVLPELKSGGVERGTVDLARYFQKKGHRSVVVSAGGPLVNDLTAAGVVHYALPVHKKSLFSVIYSVRMLTKIVEKESIDVIHARSRVPALAAYFVSRRCHIPFITTCHGYYGNHPLSRVMGWAKRVIVTSHIIGRRMRDSLGVAEEKIRLIHRGVDLEEFHFRDPRGVQADPGRIVVGMVGRMTRIKGHDLFLKAMARVVRVIPNLKVQIIGDAPKPQYKEELMVLTRRLGIAGSVEFLGTRYDVAKLMAGMSVLVAPSVGEEAFGRVIIEAGACGVPVVATKVGGIVDIIDDGVNGLLVGPQDPRSLADAVLRLIKQPSFAADLAAALRQKVEKAFNLTVMADRTLAVYEEAIRQKKILVIKLSALGDVILIIPSLRALRKKYPEAWIAVLVGRRSRKIIRNCPYVDDVIVYEASDKVHPLPLVRMSRLLAREDYDLVVDLQNNRSSHFMAFFCGAPIRAGYHNRKWSFFLNRRVKGSQAVMQPLEHQFQALKLVGVESYDKQLEFWTERSEEERVSEFLASQWISPSQILVGINPGASPRWPTKQWPAENYAKLCDELAKRNICAVLTGSADEEVLIRQIAALCRHKPINASGKTSITELAGLIRRCKVFVSSDSAPMHIAASVGVPLVAIFGPTDPKRHLVPPAHYRIFRGEVPCSPCYLRHCSLGLVCLKKIAVAEILESVLCFIHEERMTLPGVPDDVTERQMAGRSRGA